MEQTTERKQNIIEPRTHTVKDMYKWFKKKNPDTEIVYWMFREILLRHNKKAADAIIFGDVFNLGNHVGRILIKKIKRNYDKPVVDWGASRKEKKKLIEEGKLLYEEWYELNGQKVDKQTRGAVKKNNGGEKWMIYFNDPYYFRWAWSKKRVCRVKNQTVYKFLPTNNRSKAAGDFSLEKLGNKGKLTLANKLNPLLHLRYEKQLNED